ncbi:MAG: hypothetical protein N3A66_05770, partial [Planctomycetota bacterium]|nr:hypothetical protein [Planctomycetota bacterium]
VTLHTTTTIFLRPLALPVLRGGYAIAHKQCGANAAMADMLAATRPSGNAAHAPGDSAQQVFTHWSWLIELFAIIAVILTAGLISKKDDPFLLSLHPHPFWAAVLLIALRYGLVPGAIAGGTCAALHLMALQVAGAQMEISLHLASGELAAAALYPLVGIFAGEIIEQHLRRADALREIIAEQRQRIATAEARRGEIEIAYRQLEGQIAGQTDTFGALCESAKQLDSLEEKEIYSGLCRLLRRHLSAERVSIWTIAPDGAVACAEPPDAPPAPLPEIGRAALRCGAVVDASRLYRDRDDAPGGGLLAGMLRSEDQRALAVVVIEDMAFVGFTPTAVRTFELLLDWASRSLARAQRLQASRQRAIWEDELDLATPVYLKARSQEELRLAARRRAPASLLILSWEGQIAAEVCRRLCRVIARLLKHLIRLSDTASYFAERSAFVIFLPDTDAAGAETVRCKLANSLAAFGISPYGDGRPLRLAWGMAERGDSEDFEEMLQRAFADLAKGAREDRA